MDVVTREQLNVLIQLGRIDREFCKAEREFLRSIANRYQFPMQELKKLYRHPKPIGSLGALSLERRFEYMINCIEMMMIDGRVRKSEILFCQQLAVELGFKKDVVDYLKKNVGFTEIEELTQHMRLNYLSL
jgi:hypothetical protein